MIGYLKLGGAVVVLGALTWLGFIVNGWRTDAAQVPVLNERIGAIAAQVELERKQFTGAQAASKGYQDELATLRAARATAPVRVVRLCRNVPADPKPGPVPAAERGPAAGAAAAGVLPQAPGPIAGPDIGPELYRDADRCDDLAAQVRGLQDFATRQHGLEN